MPLRIKESLSWWLAPDNIFRGTLFQHPQLTLVLTTDASLQGWGAHVDTLIMQGLEEDKDLHINVLELKTILLAIHTFLHHLSGMTLAVSCDNTTAVSYLNKQGGIVSCSLCKIGIWDLGIQNNIFPVAKHVPGVQNKLVDSLSRAPSTIHEWTLMECFIRPVLYQWEHPQIDVFTDRFTSKCRLFCTRGGADPLSLGDSLHLDWSGLFLYLFAPFPQVLHKLQSQPARAILMTPWWLCQNWFPLLLQMSERTFVRLPEAPDLLHLGPHAICHHDISSLALAAWIIYNFFKSDIIQNCIKRPIKCSYASKWTRFCSWPIRCQPEPWISR